MWVTAKVIFCAPFLVTVCLIKSGCERNDPITTYKNLVEILNREANTTPSTQKILKTNSPPSHSTSLYLINGRIFDVWIYW